jgi:hypothetical protein
MGRRKRGSGSHLSIHLTRRTSRNDDGVSVATALPRFSSAVSQVLRATFGVAVLHFWVELAVQIMRSTEGEGEILTSALFPHSDQGFATSRKPQHTTS